MPHSSFESLEYGFDFNLFGRRKWLVYPQKFQITLMAINVAVTTTICLLVGLWMSRVYHGFKSAAIASGMDPNGAFVASIQSQESSVYLILSLGWVVLTIGSNLVTLVFSHRLVGPLRRLYLYFEKIALTAEPPSKKLTFRKGDFFNELAPVVNRALENITPKSKQRIKPVVHHSPKKKGKKKHLRLVSNKKAA